MPSISIPYTWIVSPPSKDILQQFYFLGIHDAQSYFNRKVLFYILALRLWNYKTHGLI